jgi:branched-chain amino acid transport system permease protein
MQTEAAAPSQDRPEPPAPDFGDRLEALFSRLAAEHIEIGIRERILAGRLTAELVAARQADAIPNERWQFLLRSHLTPVLAKSPEQIDAVRHAFADAFRAEQRLAPKPERESRPIPLKEVLPGGPGRTTIEWNWATVVTSLVALLALAMVAAAVMFWPPPPPSHPPEWDSTPASQTRPGPTTSDPPLDRLTRAEVPALATPGESLSMPVWLSVSIILLPWLAFTCWLLRRPRRFKAYLRRRTPGRPPLLHNLVVQASENIAREHVSLARAALRLGRSREGISREIDVEATVAATARAAGFPHVVLTALRRTPEYLVLIGTQGAEDHSAKRMDRLAADLAAQNLSVTRYFIAHDANLCFQDPDSSYFRLDDLAALYPDHCLIFLGAGDQLLNPGTLATWPWADAITAWPRRAILTPRPIEEWGRSEIVLARLFDGPPLPATSEGLLRLAEAFERREPQSVDLFKVGPDPVRHTWSTRPLRWLTPARQDDAASAALEQELREYLVDDRGQFDPAAFCWLAACALYPALRWDLTIYLGLNLRTPCPGGGPSGVVLYSEARALRLAALPWFRHGFMPDWLRRRLIASLPASVFTQATLLLDDLLGRAVNASGDNYDAIRLRIAQDRPDPSATRPERDEVFLEALSKADALALKAPRNLSELVSGLKHPFLAREWGLSAVVEGRSIEALHRMIFIGLAALLLVAPFVIYPVFLMKVLCFALFACAFNLLLGYGGLLSFGHAAYFGMASYVSAYTAKHWGLTPELAILLGTAVAAVLGAAFGSLAIRRQGIYFAIITLALAQMVFFFSLQAPGFTGGEEGIQAVPRGKLFGLLSLADDRVLYLVVAAIFFGGLLLIYRIIHSPFGQVCKAIRDNEPRAFSLGYRAAHKLAVFVLSATLAGLAGATKAIVFQLASLTDVNWPMSGEVVLMTLVGGMGTVFGPIAGAAVIIAMENYLAHLGSWVLVVQGVIFVACVLLFREGIVGVISKRLRQPL